MPIISAVSSLCFLSIQDEVLIPCPAGQADDRSLDESAVRHNLDGSDETTMSLIEAKSWGETEKLERHLQQIVLQSLVAYVLLSTISEPSVEADV